MREVSALDRLAALLKLAVEQPEPGRDGSWRAPILSVPSIQDLAPNFEAQPAWTALLNLASDEVTVWVREHIRNAFIHRRRWPSALTSDAVVVYSHIDNAGDYVRDEQAGLTAPQHLALVRMAWENILTPATQLTRELLEAVSGPDEA